MKPIEILVRTTAQHDIFNIFAYCLIDEEVGTMVAFDLETAKRWEPHDV
jgi:hypothetical protein